jgi:hypothetical protein
MTKMCAEMGAMRVEQASHTIGPPRQNEFLAEGSDGYDAATAQRVAVRQSVPTAWEGRKWKTARHRRSS